MPNNWIAVASAEHGRRGRADAQRGFMQICHGSDVGYVAAQEAPIAPLLDAFEFVEDRSRWGAKFRFGLFPVSDHDMRLIAQAMRADLQALGLP